MKCVIHACVKLEDECRCMHTVCWSVQNLFRALELNLSLGVCSISCHFCTCVEGEDASRSVGQKGQGGNGQYACVHCRQCVQYFTQASFFSYGTVHGKGNGEPLNGNILRFFVI